MKAAVERELKLEANDRVDLARLGGDPIEPHFFSSVYHDVDDLSLLRAGITLRRRTENGASAWQLKLPHEGARLELEEHGGPGALPPSLARVLSGVVRRRDVVPIASLSTHRSGRRVDGVEVTVDEVEVTEDRKVVDRFTEVEAELVDGPVEALDRVGTMLRELGVSEGDARPKVLRVVELPAPAKAGATALERLRGMVAAQYDELLRYDPVVRVTDDAEAVHKMRVAVRRLRSVLRTSRSMLDKGWVASLRDELDWFADQLGSVRDLDVLREMLQADAESLDGIQPAYARPLLSPLDGERAEAHERLVECMGQERYYRLLDQVEGAAAAPPTRHDDVTVEKLAAKEFRRARKRGRSLRSQTDHELHKTRIRGKRARYAAELAEGACGKKATRFIDAAKALQDVLGEHQDAVVAIGRLHGLARSTKSTGSALLAGRLIARQEERKRRARCELPAAWRRFRRKGKRAWW